MDSERKTHYLRLNEAARMPRRVICFDCESYQDKTITTTEHTFRLACMTFDTLDANARVTGETQRFAFGTPEALWGYIADFGRTSHRTVAFAHHLSFDLRLSHGLYWLPKFGYDCKGIALNTYSCWAQFRNGKKTIWLCDSLSFIPKRLEDIGVLTRTPKPPLPKPGASDELWLERCRVDTEITREAVLRVLRFLKDEDLGDFRVTGAAQATASFRHRFLRPKSLLVHDDSEALAAERRAAWTGRCEVWRHGKTSETVYEYDYEYAYTRLAHECAVPTRLVADHSGIPLIRLERVMEKYAVLADCDITTSVPVVPTNHGNRIIWPIGTFRSTVWDHEMRLLQNSNAQIAVRRYWFYRREPILKEWAEYMMAKLNMDARELDPVVRLMLKDWSRALIGRFGLRYSKLEEFGTVPNFDVCQRGIYNLDTDTTGYLLQLGNKLFEQTARVESPNSTPMVMSAIMSAARVKMWEVMQVAGISNVYYVDTDGLVVGSAGGSNLDRAIRGGLLPGLRRKSAYSGGDFRAPRNIDLGELRRVSGAPSKAARIGRDTYKGEVWESLPQALRLHRGGKVLTHERTFTVSDTDPRRVHLPGGSTAAIELPETQPESVESAA